MTSYSDTRVVFRTNAGASVGFGHLARCLRIAHDFADRGCKILFLLDTDPSGFVSKKTTFDVVELYPTQSFSTEQEDVEYCLDKVVFLGSDIVVVDDYRLGEQWEKQIYDRVNKVVVIADDDDRKHFCDFIVDSKYVGPATKHRHSKSSNQNCKRLLGPKFLIIDSKFGRPFLGKSNFQDNRTTVLVNIGGGGDWSFYSSFLEHLAMFARSNSNVLIRFLAGPYAKNLAVVRKLAEQVENLEHLEPQEDLYDVLTHTDFVITSAGTTLFEAIAADCVCLSFELAANQKNDELHLEDFGHFFTIGTLAEVEMGQFAELAGEMISQLPRLQGLKRKQQIKLDGEGARRIVSTVLGETAFGSTVNEMSSGGLELASPETQVKQASKDNWSVYAIGDQHINFYRNSRNLEKNLNNMTDTLPVSRLEHYLWWLRYNQRESFVLFKNNSPQLIFWHSQLEMGTEKFLIGGWFACCENVSGTAAFVALDNQLKMTDRQYPSSHWVAVIKHTNHFVKALNKRFNFTPISDDSPLLEVVKLAFPRATQEEFAFVHRPPLTSHQTGDSC